MRARLALAVAAGLLSLPLVAPGAASCSRIPTPDFLHLQWLGPDRLLANVGDQAGFYTPSNGIFEPVAFGDGYRRGFTSSPHGAWVLLASGDDAPQPPGRMDTCARGWGTTQAIAPREGTQRELFDWAATALVGGPTQVAVAHRDLDHLVLYRWGAWGEARALDGRGGSLSTAGGVRALGFSGDGRWLAVAPEGRQEFVVVDATTGRPAHPPVPLPEGTVPKLFVFSPGGGEVAVASTVPNGSSVMVFSIPEGRVLAQHHFDKAVVAAAWGPGPLALAFSNWSPARFGPGVVRVYNDPVALAGMKERAVERNIAALAWDPDGTVLAVGAQGLLLLGPDLRVVSDSGDLDAPPRQPPFEALRDEPAPPVRTVSVGEGGASAAPFAVPGPAVLVVAALAVGVALAAGLRRRR